MNMTAKRLGNALTTPVAVAAADGSAAAPHTFSDSSHGNAIVTPAPRSTTRREIRSPAAGNYVS